MKKTVFIAGLFGIMALTACTIDDKAVDHANNGIYQKSGNTINVNDHQPELYNEGGEKSFKEKSDDFGYVRHSRNPVKGSESPDDHYAALDREQVANIISKLSTDVPNVDDVSTLVTGRDVLIVYKTDTKDRNLTADQVKRTAFSIVPSWYRVYVSDNTALRQNIKNFSTQDVNSRDINTMIDGVIKEMTKSPQGD
jgi:hypothetical protein